MSIARLAVPAISCHILVLTLLSFCSSSSSAGKRNYQEQITALQWATRAAGLLAGLFHLCLPYLLIVEDPLVLCPAIVVCFFYACKILDLGLARARKPPVLLDRTGQKSQVSRASASLRYVWLLLTETRYAAFDIAVQQKGRSEGGSSRLWTYGPPVAIPLLVYLFPIPEMKSLLVLLFIQISFEGLHSVLHPFCPNHLFWRPFAASTLTNFWRTHWHAGAETFLRSLGYEPGKNIALYLGFSGDVARAAGVIAAFNLSGIWHGWATAVLATRPWMVGFRVWSLFMSMGLTMVLESFIPRSRRGTMAQRIFVWIFFMFASSSLGYMLPKHLLISPSMPGGHGEVCRVIAKCNGWLSCEDLPHIMKSNLRSFALDHPSSRLCPASCS